MFSFSLLYTLFMCSTVSNLHNNNNWLFDNLLIQLFAILLTKEIFWLNYYWVSSTLSCPFIFQHDQSNGHSWSRRFSFSSRELHREYALAYLSIPHAYWCLFIIYYFIIRCICWCVFVYTLPLAAFAFFISFSYDDIVGGLLVTSSSHLSVLLLVYLCNKLVIVVAIAFLYCS